MPRVPNLFVPSEQLRPVQLPAFQGGPGVQPFIDTQSQQIEKLGAGMERLGEGAMTYAGTMRAVEKLQAQEAQRRAQEQARLQDRVDDAKLKQEDASFAEFASSLLRDPKTGYLPKQGQNALDSYQSTLDAFDKRSKEIEDSLQNDVQRTTWRNISTKRRTAFATDVDGHYSQEAKKADISATEAHIISNRNDAVLAQQSSDPNKQSRFSGFRQTIIDNAHHLSDLKGIADPDLRKNNVLEELDRLHFDVVNGLLHMDRPKDAKEYFDKIPDGDVSANMKSGLSNAVSKANARDDGIKLAVDAMKPLQGPQRAGSFADIAIQERSDRLQQFEDVKASFYKQISDGTLEPTTGMNAIRQVESMQEQEQRAYVLKAKIGRAHV